MIADNKAFATTVKGYYHKFLREHTDADFERAKVYIVRKEDCHA